MLDLKMTALAVGATAVLAVATTWGFTSSYYTAQLTAYKNKVVAEQRAAQLAAAKMRREKEEAVASAVASADRQHYEELQNAKTEIDRLRTGLAAGTVRLRQTRTTTCGNNAVAASRTSMGNDGPTERAASEPAVEQDILRLGEYALTAVKQRDACVEILHKEREVLNEGKD